jgi:hypothetical protein
VPSRVAAAPAHARQNTPAKTPIYLMCVGRLMGARQYLAA